MATEMGRKEDERVVLIRNLSELEVEKVETLCDEKLDGAEFHQFSKAGLEAGDQVFSRLTQSFCNPGDKGYLALDALFDLDDQQARAIILRFAQTRCIGEELLDLFEQEFGSLF